MALSPLVVNTRVKPLPLVPMLVDQQQLSLEQDLATPRLGDYQNSSHVHDQRVFPLSVKRKKVNVAVLVLLCSHLCLSIRLLFLFD